MSLYGELPELTTADGATIHGFPIEILNPPKTCVVRLPTSGELLTYLGEQRSLYRSIGRGGESKEIDNPKADQTLFRAIRLDKTPPGEEFDDAEALHALNIITKCIVTNCVREGQTYLIDLSTIFGVTTHTVSIPLHKDMAEYRRNVYVGRDLPHNVEQRRFPPEVPVALYDKIIVATHGYADSTKSAIPPHHKRAVVAELMSTLASLDPQLDPNS